MTVQRADEQADGRRAEPARTDATPEFPVREYICAMAVELGQMARWDGDEALGRLLDSVAALAAEPLARAPVEIARPKRRRPT